MLLSIDSSGRIGTSSDGASGTPCPLTHTNLLQSGSAVTAQIIIAWVDLYHIIDCAIAFTLALYAHCFLILNHGIISQDEDNVL